MGDIKRPHSENEDEEVIKMPDYRKRNESGGPAGERNRWMVPLALLLLIIVAIGIFLFVGKRRQSGLYRWLMGRFTLAEQEVQIILPATLFAGRDIDEIITKAVEEKGVSEINWLDENTLVFNMSPETKEILQEEAAGMLEERVAAMKGGRQYPYILDLSHDSPFREFYLVTRPEQAGSARAAAAELLIQAAYYQHFAAADEKKDPVVKVTIETDKSEEPPEMLVYPADLDRASALVENPPEPTPEPETPSAGDKVIVTTGPDNLNLRSGPEITYLIIDILSSGTVLEVIGTEGAWLEVITPDGKEGWVHGNYVELYTETETDTDETD